MENMSFNEALAECRKFKRTIDSMAKLTEVIELGAGAEAAVSELQRRTAELQAQAKDAELRLVDLNRKAADVEANSRSQAELMKRRASEQAQEIVAKANAEAEAIVREAEAKVANATERAAELETAVAEYRQHIEDLRAEKQEILNRTAKARAAAESILKGADNG